MEVEEKKAAVDAEYKGKPYYFCVPGCKKAFVKNPDMYPKGELGMKHMKH